MWPPGVVLPDPLLSETFKPLPADFASREVFAVDAGDPEQVAAWLGRYGPPDDADDTAAALIGAQQAASFVLADLIGEDDAPEPFVTATYREHLESFREHIRSRRADAETAGHQPDDFDRGHAHGQSQAYSDVLAGLDALETPAHEAEQWIAARLHRWAPRLIVEPDATPHLCGWDVAVAVQLFNYVSRRPPWQRCANDPAHPGGRGQWFTVQRTRRRARDGYGPNRSGVRFCSDQCRKAFTERERRRRLRDQRKADS